jgi:hypothetical protein
LTSSVGVAGFSSALSSDFTATFLSLPTAIADGKLIRKLTKRNVEQKFSVSCCFLDNEPWIRRNEYLGFSQKCKITGASVTEIFQAFLRHTFYKILTINTKFKIPPYIKSSILFNRKLHNFIASFSCYEKVRKTAILVLKKLPVI